MGVRARSGPYATRDGSEDGDRVEDADHHRHRSGAVADGEDGLDCTGTGADRPGPGQREVARDDAGDRPEDQAPDSGGGHGGDAAGAHQQHGARAEHGDQSQRDQEAGDDGPPARPGALTAGAGQPLVLVEPGAGVPVAVPEVDRQADEQPHHEPQPGLDGEVGHQPQAEHAGDDRQCRRPRHGEAALQVGVAAPQHGHREAHQHEGRQGADVDHLRQLVHVGEGGDDRHDDTAEDLQPGGRAPAGGVRQAPGQQSVATHREDHPGQAEQQHHDHRRQADQDADGDDRAHPVGADEAERGGQRRGLLLGHLLVAHHAGDDDGDRDVQQGDQGQAAEDAARQGALRVLGLLGGGGDDVEADEREEHQRRCTEQAVHAVTGGLGAGEEGEQALGHHAGRVGAGRLGRGQERREVGGLHIERAGHDDEQRDADLDHGQHAVDPGGQLGAEHQQDGEQGDDQHRRPGRGEPTDRDLRRQVDVQELEDVVDVDAPVLRDHRGGHQHLEDQVPADDPGDQLPQRHVRERVRRARHRDGRGELRVVHHRESADHGGDQEGDDDRGPCVLGGGLRPDREDAGAHRDGHAHHGDVPGGQLPLQTAFGISQVLLDLTDGLLHEETHASTSCSGPHALLRSGRGHATGAAPSTAGRLACGHVSLTGTRHPT
ncbi:hypothetical protein SDC9_77577 [bioreactor metagenome]|uniref:Uncharacterized protein n=1 Tax=bioreactor metagenome TaxID=1076179 RepID=A0A644YYH5_9ZZZZ